MVEHAVFDQQQTAGRTGPWTLWCHASTVWQGCGLGTEEDMATDVRLDDGPDGTYLVLEGRVVQAVATDFMVDSPARRKSSKPHRRALVHTEGDGLTINYDNDYDGGVTIEGVVELAPKAGPGLAPGRLPVLLVRGGISYQVKVLPLERGGESTRTVSLDDELNKLQAEIVNLTKRVKELEAHQ
jgi:hypothetical protein